MEKVNYLNVGCGGKFHLAWTNIDMVAADLSHGTWQPQAIRSGDRWRRLVRGTPAKVGGWVRKKLLVRWGSEALKGGSCQLAGEVHLWMYASFLLDGAFSQAGFADVRLVDTHQCRGRASVAGVTSH